MDRERAEEQIQIIREYNEALRQERDKLRAEVARLTAEVAKDREWLGRALDKQAEYLRQCGQLVEERDTLRAEAARLREALVNLISNCQRGPNFLATKPQRRFISEAQSALAATPTTAEWLAARDAEQRRIGAAEWLEKTAAENHERFGTHFYESTTDSFVAEAARLRAGKGETDAGAGVGRQGRRDQGAEGGNR